MSRVGKHWLCRVWQLWCGQVGRSKEWKGWYGQAV